MSERVLVKSRAAENFGVKAQILDLKIQEKVDMLNKMYKGKIEFEPITFNKRNVFTKSQFPDIEDTNIEGIRIKDIDKTLISVELPECKELCMQDIINIFLFYKHSWEKKEKSQLTTIKFPKCMDAVLISKKISWQNQISRIFMWDTTRLEFDEDFHGGENALEMIVVLSTTGKKPRFIKLRS